MMIIEDEVGEIHKKIRKEKKNKKTKIRLEFGNHPKSRLIKGGRRISWVSINPAAVAVAAMRRL